jgi:hypothetical protein
MLSVAIACGCVIGGEKFAEDGCKMRCKIPPDMIFPPGRVDLCIILD